MPAISASVRGPEAVTRPREVTAGAAAALLGVTLRASLAPLATPPAYPPAKVPMVVWEGGAQKGGHGGGTLVARGHPCPLPPRYRQPSAGVIAEATSAGASRPRPPQRTVELRKT